MKYSHGSLPVFNSLCRFIPAFFDIDLQLLSITITAGFTSPTAPDFHRSCRFYIPDSSCSLPSLLLATLYFPLTESRCQISSTYCLIVRSDENLPEQAVFIMAILAQPFLSR